MRTAAVIVAFLGLVLRTFAWGWVYLWFGVVFYPAVCIAHVAVHFRALRRENSKEQLRLAVASNILLLAALLLQLDFGEGGYGWMTITRLIYHYSFSHPAAEFRIINPNMDLYFIVDLGVFVPVAITWALMLRHRLKSDQSTHGGKAQIADA